ncbi:ABC transporter substrate-binding protein [Sediminispirochaeta smaragdinae]|uniref:LysR substrate-binding protein n=1 Tax=Sediminispirochaeta smaragdinae (strain DSM 11293 / JCM 15392 / SEBR 4228) TaxID=573413 RepID=E1R6E7_SEDSS|nr:ABC transporter substrate-binding protein [Sediminispirochaeta smaragdinae]ADK80965.1 LysR substrate-binding protein [Sediminispirochaeta smaragdinae DSM 11293]
MRKPLMFLIVLLAAAGVLYAGGQTEASSPEAASSLSGVVTVYTPHGAEITDPILDAFRAKYPDIRIQIVNAGTGELLSRLEAEKDNPTADVMWGGDTISFESYSHLFASYESPEDASMMKSDPAHKWHPFSVLCQPILVNTDLVAADAYPSTVKQLADAAWKDGKIALADPNKSGTGYTIVSGLVNAYGWDFIGKLLDNCVVTPGSDAMFKAIKDGEVAVGFINEDLGAKWEQEGLPVKMIYAKDAVTVQMDAVALVANSPSPEIGKVVLDFICSADAHTIAVEQISRRSARIDVDPPSILPALGQLNLFPANEPRQVVNAKFEKLAQ